MTTRVEPRQKNSTHDLNLISLITEVPLVMCDKNGARNPLAFKPVPINRGSLKMYTGVAKYADLEPPWTPISQSDWSGGRGAKDFDKDETMYYDGYGVNTLRAGEVILGPKATEINIAASSFSNTEWAGAYTSYNIAASTIGYIGFRFAAGASLTASTVALTVMDPGVHPTITVGIGDFTTSLPSGFTWSNTYTTTGSFTNVTFTLASGKSLTSGTDYSLVIKIDNSANTSSTSLRYRLNTSTNDYYTSSDGSTWVQGTDGYPPYYTISSSATTAKALFFEYKGAVYAVMKNDSAAACKLYINGDAGAVKSSTSTVVTVESSTKVWAADEAIGSIIKIVSGTAANQPQPWRVITNNIATPGSAVSGDTTFTVSPAWDVSPAANDIYAIVASDEWTEVTDFDTAYNVDVTDVLSINGAMYFACGDTEVIKRGVGWNNGGTWQYDFSGEAGQDVETGAFTHLSYVSDQQGNFIWGAKGGFPATIAKATAWDATTYSGTETLLTFGSAIAVGDQWERITGLETYGEYGNLHIFKEGSLWQVMDDKPYKIDIREMQNTKDERNGRAHCVHGVYLYFGWHNTVERYYNKNLDGVGPDKAEVAFPTPDRAGHFTSLVGYPGLVFGSVDAGTSGVSSVLAYNGQGWCELYNAPTGLRIQNLFIQSIPGNTVDRLWISAGNQIVWIPLSLDPYNHPDSSYTFRTTGELVTAWYYLGLVDVYKFFNSLRLVIDNGSSTQYVKAYYQIDDETGWTDIYGNSTTYKFDTFSEEIDLTAIPQENGRRIRFKFELTTSSSTETPRILASVLEAAVRVPTKYQYMITARLEDYDRTLSGAPEDKDPTTSSFLASAKYTNLLTLQGLTVPVRVESTVPMLDGIYAFVDSVSPVPYKVATEEGLKDGYAVSFSLIEV